MSPNSTMFGPRRNPLISKWNVLFEVSQKEWISFKPALGLNVYPCYACRHMFSSHKTFKDHVNRRAIVLQYVCPVCPREDNNYIFYNRCALLLHARTHFTLERGEIDLNNLEISTLPFGLAGFLPCPDIPILFENEEQPMESNVYVNSQFYSPSIEYKGKSIIVMSPTDLIINKSGQENLKLALKQLCRNLPLCKFITAEQQKELRNQTCLVEIKEEPAETTNEDDDELSLMLPVITKVETVNDSLAKCYECGCFMQKTALKSHLLGDHEPSRDHLKCYVCRYVAPTDCSLCAHERIHEKLAPFICPDCGEEYNNYEQLTDHMDTICYHTTKSIRFRCPGKKCNKIFAITQTFAAHFKMHIKLNFECNYCPIVCCKQEDIFKHIEGHRDNNDTIEGKQEYKKTFNCSVCTNAPTMEYEEYEKHVVWHATDNRKGLYIYMCKHCRGYFRSTMSLSTHLEKCIKNPENRQPLEARPKPPIEEKCDSTQNNSSRYVSGECEACHNKIIYSKEKRVTLCFKCKDQPENNKCYCILCKTRILLSERKHHQKICKFGRPKVILDRIEIETSEKNSSTSSSDFDSPTKEPSRKKQRKFAGKDKSKRVDLEVDPTAEQPIEFNGTYHCKFCEFTETDRTAFHSHIKTHRHISTAYQCMECAECFVVKPSLMKHLVHYHNIGECDRYFKDNDCFDEGAVKELSKNVRLAPYIAKEAVKENQCKVCLEEFDSETELNTHFRKHGMAFLMNNSL